MRLRRITNWVDPSTGDAFDELRPQRCGSVRVGLSRALALLSSEPGITR